MATEKNSKMLSADWEGPYGGVPPWDAVVPEQFEATFTEAFTAADAELATIADNKDEPTFANTIVAMENMAKPLNNLEVLLSLHVLNLNTDTIAKAEEEVMPQLAAYQDKIIQNEALFKRVKTLVDQEKAGSLKDADGNAIAGQEKRLLEKVYRNFTRKGATLSATDKVRVSEINKRLAALFSQFTQAVMKEEKAITWVEKESELDGLSTETIASLKAAAKEAGKPDQWAVPNTRSSVEPVLEGAKNRELRQRVLELFQKRGYTETSNNEEIVREIVVIRSERAELFGYTSHAAWILEDNMAKNPEAAMDLMISLWTKAKERVKEEVKEMLDLSQGNSPSLTTIEPWDYRYLCEKVRVMKYDLDYADLMPYLVVENLFEGCQWCAGQLYGLKFVNVTKKEGISLFHPDVQVLEVQKDGEVMGVMYADHFARQGKRSGAWMTSYRVQHRIPGEKPSIPIVSCNCNFTKAGNDGPNLISYADATTLFHEFGHCLHGLLSDVTYPTLSGTNVVRDFVELPSQLNEKWLGTTEVLEKFARHYDTNEPVPEALITKIKNVQKFRQGFDSTEFLSCAILDMQLHTLPREKVNTKDFSPFAFESKALSELGMPSEVPMRHRLAHFQHLFADDGYSAGYYSYLWADALVADAAEAFEESGFYNAELATSYLKELLSRGDSRDAGECFRVFRGRDVETAALSRMKGFPV